jgi:3'(2'), 5'-bisphosphate nucleotidase
MYDKELSIALDAVRQASKLCAQVQRILVTEETLEKKDKSPVTIADYGAQAVISYKLDMSFPEVPLVGEEDAAILREDSGAAMREKVGAFVNQMLPDAAENDWLDAIDRGASRGGATGRFWTLDPVDGTKGFIRGD